MSVSVLEWGLEQGGGVWGEECMHAYVGVEVAGGGGWVGVGGDKEAWDFFSFRG